MTDCSVKGLVWGSLWVSFAFLLGRAYTRWTVFRRFFADDGMILLAWILILINAALWQSMVDNLYLIYAVTVGAVQPPADLMSVLNQYMHRTVAVTFLNLFSLWSTKTSFLIFLYRMGNNVRGHNIFWWTAAIACVIGLAISIGVQNYKCIIGSPAAALGKIVVQILSSVVADPASQQIAVPPHTDALSTDHYVYKPLVM